MGTVQTAPKLGTLTFDVSASSDIGTTFETAKSASTGLPTLVDSSVRFVPEYLVVKLAQIGTATKLTIAISTDSDGDDIVIPDTERTSRSVRPQPQRASLATPFSCPTCPRPRPHSTFTSRQTVARPWTSQPLNYSSEEEPPNDCRQNQCRTRSTMRGRQR